MFPLIYLSEFELTVKLENGQTSKRIKRNIYYCWAVVVVEWSACSPSTPTIQVQITLKSILCCEKAKIGKKRSGLGIVFKNHLRPGVDFKSKYFIFATNS